MSSDFVEAPSTIATSTKPHDTSNIISDTIRPNYRKTFHKAIARQRINIMAINAFASGNRQKTKVNFAKSACDALPQQFVCHFSRCVHDTQFKEKTPFAFGQRFDGMQQSDRERTEKYTVVRAVERSSATEKNRKRRNNRPKQKQDKIEVLS